MGRPAMSGHCCSAAELISLPANALSTARMRTSTPAAAQTRRRRTSRVARSGGSSSSNSLAAASAGARRLERGMQVCRHAGAVWGCWVVC